jgi:hypothetical protein
LPCPERYATSRRNERKTEAASGAFRGLALAKRVGVSFAETKRQVRRVVACLLLLCVPACAIAFTPGTKLAPAPEKFPEADKASHDERQSEENIAITHVPTFGVSLVVGGSRFDAGGLPPPPIPVVLVP